MTALAKARRWGARHRHRIFIAEVGRQDTCETIRARVREGMRTISIRIVDQGWDGLRRTHAEGSHRRLGTLSSNLPQEFHPKTISSKNGFIQKHSHPKTLSSKTVSSKWKTISSMTISSQNGFIQRHFRPKTVSSNDTFVQKRFHPITYSSKKQFHPKMTICLSQPPNTTKITIIIAIIIIIIIKSIIISIIVIRIINSIIIY